MKKILLVTLSLAVMFMLDCPIMLQAEGQAQTYLATASFEDMVPSITHGDPMAEYGGRIPCVISCNMVLKPKTQIHLSRLCESAITNVNYYFNSSTSDIQKGPDYNNTVEDEIFYPASKQISNSYIGGTVSYKIGSDFQTKKTSGEKIYKETSNEFYQAVIISSITKEVDLGVATQVSVPTGDQSQPYWVGTSGVFPGFEGVYVPWEFNFGYIDDNSSSGAFSFFKAKNKSEHIINIKAGYFGIGDGHIIFGVGSTTTSLNDELKNIVLSAKKLNIRYNENENACDGNSILVEDGWENVSSEDFAKFSIEEDGNISYPPFMNAWIRIDAVVSSPSDNDYRPAKRVRVKSRISAYGGFKFNNLKDGDVVKIYTVNGQKVAELTTGESSSGFEWKGRKGTNNSGDWAKSGIYVYQIKLKEENKIISGTIVLAY